MNEPVLCYIDGPWAFFTTQDLKKQWGDDWGKSSYEHNAGDPYTAFREEEQWEITKVAFIGPFDSPADGGAHYSVEMINNKEIPWLSPDRYDTYKDGRPAPIFAGATLDEFIERIESAGGTVYLPRNQRS